MVKWQAAYRFERRFYLLAIQPPFIAYHLPFTIYHLRFVYA